MLVPACGSQRILTLFSLSMCRTPHNFLVYGIPGSGQKTPQHHAVSGGRRDNWSRQNLLTIENTGSSAKVQPDY
jgi:hypothetical protein